MLKKNEKKIVLYRRFTEASEDLLRYGAYQGELVQLVDADEKVVEVFFADSQGEGVGNNKALFLSLEGYIHEHATTTDDTATQAITYTLPDDHVYHVEMKGLGVKADGTDRASYQKIATVYRTGAGNATIQGSVTNSHTAESNASWDADITVSGSDVRVTVTGVTATTIEWNIYLSIKRLAE